MKKVILLILLSFSLYTITFAETEKELFDNGVLFFKQGHYTHAVNLFSKLIELAPDNADIYRNRGVSYMKQEKFDLAIKDFEKAKELFPELKGIHNNLGVAWFYKKNYQKALENYDIEIKAAPENYVAYFNRALCLGELNRNKEALDDLSQTLALKPDFYLAICYKADLLAQQGENAKAIETYEAAIRQTNATTKSAHLQEKIKKEAAIKHTYATTKLAQLKQKIKEKKNIETPKNKPEIKTNSNKRYAIQLGAFLYQENANRIKKDLLQQGIDSRILILTDTKKRTWYLLRSGDYPDKAAANKSMISLNEELGLKSVVRPLGSW